MTTVVSKDAPSEEAPSVAANSLGTISRVVAVALSVFAIWAVLFSTLDPYLHRALFTTVILALGFLAAASSAPHALDAFSCASARRRRSRSAGSCPRPSE